MWSRLAHLIKPRLIESVGSRADESRERGVITPDRAAVSHAAKAIDKTVYFTPESTPPYSADNNQLALTMVHDAPPGPPQLTVELMPEALSSIREQFDLQQQVANQFEAELAAREELISALSAQLQKADASLEKYKKEVERRQGAMRALRQKISELESICRGLEEEVERSREESFDRSIMDKASEGALVMLHGEVERLRKQVHDLQQESADKDLKLVQLMKARAQDKEDIEGLNIALDSKQQELELIKRKLGVKGTAGATPVPSRVGLPEFASRRDSLPFATPSVPKPKSGSTTGVSKGTTTSDAEAGVRPLESALGGNDADRGPAAGASSTPRRNSVNEDLSTVSVSRPTSNRPHSALAFGSHGKSSSNWSTANSALSDDEDKENAVPVRPTAKRTIAVPS